MADADERDRHVRRYGLRCSEAEALLCAAAILDRWGSLKPMARQLESAAESFEARAAGELEKALG